MQITPATIQIIKNTLQKKLLEVEKIDTDLSSHGVERVRLYLFSIHTDCVLYKAAKQLVATKIFYPNIME